MFYSLRHSTRFRYSDAVRQSVMEVRMQPRSEGNQSVRQFDLTITPRSRAQAYRDFMGNLVHHFDVPGQHDTLSIIAESLVEVDAPTPLPETLPEVAWDELDETIKSNDHWDFLMPSKFCQPTELLTQFGSEIGLERRADPLSVVRELNTQIYQFFEYRQQFTRVDSPIDEALEARQGVCQDFTHIMIALLRQIGVPARYVSGYLFHRSGSSDRSVADATHAWIEVLLPGLNWVGFDPTNDLVCSERHIRTAIGRDYADVTPTRGTYKGTATEEMRVAVNVSPSDAPLPREVEPMMPTPWVVTTEPRLEFTLDGEEEMVQQQQQ